MAAESQSATKPSALQSFSPTATVLGDLTTTNTLSRQVTTDSSSSSEEEEATAAASLSPTTTSSTALLTTARPGNVRSTTEPSTSKFLQVHRSEVVQPRLPRNQSPFSRPHLRSFSASGPASTPAMQRTRSLPLVSDAARVGLRHSSPSRSPVRTPSPLRPSSSSGIAAATIPRTAVGVRRSFDDSMSQQSSSLSSSFTEIEIIEEDSELEVAPRPQLTLYEPDGLWNSTGGSSSSSSYYSPTQQYGYTFSRSNSNSRRRPASPLHHATVAPPPSSNYQTSPSSTPPPTYATLHSYQTPPTSVPAIQVVSGTGRFNEPFPQSAASSVPSTPTSLRSRSPSISSLETIPDSPDAEEAAALEAFEINKLKIAADEADVADGRGRTWGFGLASATVAGGGGGVGSKQDKRKRWSVCGAERRGDFEMETIWED